MRWRRPRVLVLCAVIFAALLFTYYSSTRETITPPPLPGTYQYFVETDFHSSTHSFGAISHCDSRFAPEKQPEIEDVRRSLKALLESYVTTMQTLKIETWIAHGVLLGWHWNKKFLPWDTDIDVQMSADSLAILAKSYNMTQYHHSFSDGTKIRNYLLDVNPHHRIVSIQDVSNKIDARWIDMEDGKFIDITAVHHNPVGGSSNHGDVLFCKDGHHYKACCRPEACSICND